ncbi:MAG: ribulose-phosphate 3-epimerase [Armatimonadetes bacterium]|nr:MAG: ribulose-phosphate 3-epimerase [Armatimonadota bacterium]
MISDSTKERKIQIIPAILAVTEEEYKDKLDKIRAGSGLAQGWVQIDFMDNKFVQNKSITPDIVARYPINLKKEAHLMVKYPQNWIDDLVKVDIDRVVFPIEDEAGIDERITQLRNHGIQVGLSLNPDTPLAKVEPFVSKIDLLLLLSVQPGFSGQKFIPEVLEKVKEADKFREINNYLQIEVDGGIKPEVIREVVQAGADNIVIGGYLTDGDITEHLEKIWEAFTGN